ncbi:IS630 family transposase [Rhizophagus clarus]|uniref:IS630 family transposase n=1 Tax=Rhizophagus clarus TaxID=94130 RepID=A0A8H3LLS7_9GLOM|nr:IS630 family transposase [Rhizophagus clarus]
MPGKQVSKTNQERIIGTYLIGTKQRVISVQLNIPESTVYDIVKKYKETDDVTDKFNTSLDTTFHYNTVRRYLHNEGLGSYTAKKKPRLTEKHRTDRLKWCKDKKNWAEEWKQVVWSDKSKFALFQSDGRAKVWRSPEEMYNKDCIQSTVKFGGGSVMFWGCFGWHGVGPLIVVEGNMDSDEYVNILANHFIPWVDNYPNSIFQQDGASCHTSTYTVWWMRTHNIPILDWVAQSPDLNPIENLWNHLDSQVQKRKPVPRSKQELIEVIQDEWRKITIETCQRLILSMPNRVKAVIKAKGGHTKY